MENLVLSAPTTTAKSILNILLLTLQYKPEGSARRDFRDETSLQSVQRNFISLLEPLCADHDYRSTTMRHVE